MKRHFKDFKQLVNQCNVILQVLDARDPLGTRSVKAEQYIMSNFGGSKVRQRPLLFNIGWFLFFFIASYLSIEQSGYDSKRCCNGVVGIFIDISSDGSFLCST